MEESVIQVKSGIMINVDVGVKNILYVKKIIFGILQHVVPKMVNINIKKVLLMTQLLCVMKLKKKQKIFQQILMKKKEPCKTKFLYLLPFLLVIIALLIAVTIYCYLMQYKSKQKYL